MMMKVSGQLEVEGQYFVQGLCALGVSRHVGGPDLLCDASGLALVRSDAPEVI